MEWGTYWTILAQGIIAGLAILSLLSIGVGIFRDKDKK